MNDKAEPPKKTQYDPTLPVRPPGTRAVKPRDAATLIIYRRVGATTEVLMGERHVKHRFLPQRYVFPGGRLDASDSRVRVGAPLDAAVAAQMARMVTPRRAAALAAAAVRETFEETGLLLGAPDPSPGKPVPESWKAFFATGLAPSLAHLEYIARAVTPPLRPIRFNARFFMVDARHITGEIGGSGELLNLHWVPIADARRLEIPVITGKILGFIETLTVAPRAPSADRLIPMFRNIHGVHRQFEE
ncbi:MAG: NUDIX hydrolase [Alphaproteobacteria bacterium]|nr:NUDIX hydrolase [Alphaproteobacteria bacterium]